MIILLGIGRLDLAMFAIFGAFTGIYGRSPGHLDRLVEQTRSGVLFFAVILGAGLTSSHIVEHGTGAGTWTVVALTTFVAWGCNVLAGFLRLRPAGPLFHIFAFAAIASTPDLPPIQEGMLTATLAIMLSIGIGVVEWLLPHRRTVWRRETRHPITPELARTIWLDSLAVLVAAGAAGAVATLTQSMLATGHNYWAMVAAVVPLVGHTTRHRLARGVHRILGTYVGLGIIAVIIALEPNIVAAVFIIGVMQVGAEMFMARNYFLGQMFVTPMALIGVALTTGLGPNLLWDRFVETTIGAIIGMTVALASAWFARQRRRKVAAARRVAA
nr:FUSC family protein [Tessaracoccus sp. OS52]